jgi:hypothetical protein
MKTHTFLRALGLVAALTLGTQALAANPAPTLSPCMQNVEAVNQKIPKNKQGKYTSSDLEKWIKAVQAGHPTGGAAKEGFKADLDAVTDNASLDALRKKYGAYTCTPDYSIALSTFLLNAEKKEMSKNTRATMKKFFSDESFWMPSVISIAGRIAALRAAERASMIAFRGDATMGLNSIDTHINEAYMSQMRSAHTPGKAPTADWVQIAKKDYTDSFQFQKDFQDWIAANL